MKDQRPRPTWWEDVCWCLGFKRVLFHLSIIHSGVVCMNELEGYIHYVVYFLITLLWPINQNERMLLKRTKGQRFNMFNQVVNRLTTAWTRSLHRSRRMWTTETCNCICPTVMAVSYINRNRCLRKKTHKLSERIDFCVSDEGFTNVLRPGVSATTVTSKPHMG